MKFNKSVYPIHVLVLPMVQILKFTPEWVTFEHEGKCYSINFDHEINHRELSEIAKMTFEEVRKKYNLECDSEDAESGSCSCC